MTNDFEPIIVGFLCNWCSYEGADAAGRARQCYPPNLRVIRVMCSGRVDPQFVFQAFAQGADGVLILGCHPGDCHYKDGNRQALKRYTVIRSMLDALGIEQDRLHLDWISASEQEKFVQVVSEMTERVRRLGPLNAGNGPQGGADRPARAGADASARLEPPPEGRAAPGSAPKADP